MTDTTPASSHSHDITTLLDPLRVAITAQGVAIEKLAARIAALEQGQPVPPPVDPPPVDPPPVVGKVVQFPATGTATAFANLVADLSIDVIEMAGGTYPKWSCFLGAFGINSARPSTRPLLVRPVPGAAVIWDGTGLADNNPPFRMGWNALTSYITFDPAGGSFTAQNYRLGKVGLVMARYYDHVTFNGLIVRNVEGGFGDGIPGQQQHTHALYLSTDGTHRSKSFTANGWDVVGPANRMLNGLQTDGGPNADGVVAKGWKVRSLHRAVYAWSDPTGLVIDGWDIADCNVTIDNYKGQQTSQGVVSNCKAVNAGPLANGQGMWGGTRLVSGGGNTAA